MRRIALIFLSLLPLFAVALFTPAHAASSQDMTVQSEAETTKSAIVDYNLSFPGMLPDNPLYKIKTLRNKIIEFFIFDPGQKVNFYLHEADKGILATAMLVDFNKVELAEETALKAEHYYTKIAQEMYKINKQPSIDFFEKLDTAAHKHQEVLSALAKKVPAEKRQTFLTVIDFSKRNLAAIKEYQDKIYYGVEKPKPESEVEDGK